MTRKRSRYRPRNVNPQAHLMAMQGAALLSQADRERWALQLLLALDDVRRGQAGEQAWTEIFNAINVADALVLQRVARDPQGTVRAAQDACVAILERQRTTGTRAAWAGELAALRELQAAWVDLLDGITHSERFAAEELVQRRTASAQAGGMGAHVVVIEPPKELRT
jgi:hypothetical protein